MNSNGISPNFENCNGIHQKNPLLFNCFNSTFQQHLKYFENNFYHGYYCSHSMNLEFAHVAVLRLLRFGTLLALPLLIIY